MAEEGSKGAEKVKKQRAQEITFRCPSCGRYKPLDEMRTVTRFFPVLLVCRECEKEMR